MNNSYILFIIFSTVASAIITNVYWYQAINKDKNAEAIMVNIFTLTVAVLAQVAAYPGYLVRGSEPSTWEALGLAVLFLILNVSLSLTYLVFNLIQQKIAEHLTMES